MVLLNKPQSPDEYQARLKRTLDGLFGKAEQGYSLRLNVLEVQTLAQFVLELTAQNADLAARLEAAMEHVPEELKQPSEPIPWSPMS